jgi:hypothetical protein
MLNLRNSLIALAMAAVSFTAGAQEIYKSVDEDGVVEYSDMPSEGAQAISVDPNVVDVTPENRAGASREAAAGMREGAAESARQPREDLEDDDGVDRRQREKMEAKERAGGIKEEQREGGAQRPANGGGVNRGTRPAGGGRR